jgi:hypothetical protein
VTIHPTNPQDSPTPEIPKEYKRHEKVFSEEKSQRLPQHTIWDHAIELLPNAPVTLPARLLPLNYKEREKMQKFIEEPLQATQILYLLGLTLPHRH